MTPWRVCLRSNLPVSRPVTDNTSCGCCAAMHTHGRPLPRHCLHCKTPQMRFSPLIYARSSVVHSFQPTFNLYILLLDNQEQFEFENVFIFLFFSSNLTIDHFYRRISSDQSMTTDCIDSRCCNKKQNSNKICLPPNQNPQYLLFLVFILLFITIFFSILKISIALGESGPHTASKGTRRRRNRRTNVDTSPKR